MDTIIKELEANLSATLAKFKEDIRGVRSSRPSPEIVENIMVSAYDSMMPVKQLGTITIGSSREVIVSLWDKDVIAPTMKAIEDARIGLSLQNDGLIIRGFLPALTAERREEFMKLAKRISEDARIQVRGKREEAIKKLKAAEEGGELNEDDVFKGKEKVQKIVDSTNAEIEKALEAKIKELGE